MTGFGPDYIIPKPFDPRLILHIAPAVARAAMESGVARRPITDFDAYQSELEKFVYRSGQLMRPVFDVARQNPRRVVYAEGEEERVLRAVQTVVDEGLAHPILIGRREVILEKTEQLGLRLDFNKQTSRILDPLSDEEFFAPLTERYQRWWNGAACSRNPPRAGSPPATASPPPCCWMPAKSMPRLCGGLGDWTRQLTNILPIIPRQRGCQPALFAVRPDPAQWRAVLLRHPCQCRSHRRADRGNDPAGGQDSAPLRPCPQGRAVVAFQLRHLQVAQRHQDAQGAGPAARRRARFGNGRRNACRCGAERSLRGRSSPTAH